MKALMQALPAALVCFCATCGAHAEDGVDKDRILFGQAAPLEGPAASLGRDMRLGLLAAFDEVNRNGGVRGRRLDLTSRDDSGNPNKSVAVTKALIESDKVFALVGAVGTPTSFAAQPIASAAGIPFVGAFTGAQFLRDASKTQVVNVRASDFEETETIIDQLTRFKGLSRIAVLYQDDALGRTGLKGVEQALERRHLEPVAEGAFERNTTAIKTALLSIRKGNPDAIVLVAPYKSSAEFIRLAHRLAMTPQFATTSFVGDSLAKELGAEGAGVVSTRVVPFPGDYSIPFVHRYQDALKAVAPQREPGFVTLEGYMVGRLVIAALEKLEDEPNRNNFLETIFGNRFDFKGVTLDYAANNHGSASVSLSIIQADGSQSAIDSLN